MKYISMTDLSLTIISIKNRALFSNKLLNIKVEYMIMVSNFVFIEYIENIISNILIILL